MPLENPWYIGTNARHRPNQQRLLANIASENQEGVLAPTHLRVEALPTPGAGITVLPGGYAVLAKHAGGQYESYVGKIASSDDVGPSGNGIVAVGATNSSGSRTDLVVLVIKDPYVTGAGSWDIPEDAEDGPYAEIVVIPGVPANTNSVLAVEPNWSAITLARITRPSSTGVDTQAHITDLRSLIDLEGQRIVIIESPPSTPPPIAQQVYAASTNCNNGDGLNRNNTSWMDWPQKASWQVPVPSWAYGVSVMLMGTPASRQNVWAEVRMNFNNTSFTARNVDINNAGDEFVDVYRANVPYGGVYSVPSNARGKVVTVKMQARSLYSTGTTNMLLADTGCYYDLWLLFQRYPS